MKIADDDVLPARVGKVNVTRDPVDCQILHHLDTNGNDVLVSRSVQHGFVDARFVFTLLVPIDETVFVITSDAVRLRDARLDQPIFFGRKRYVTDISISGDENHRLGTLVEKVKMSVIITTLYKIQALPLAMQVRLSLVFKL